MKNKRYFPKDIESKWQEVWEKNSSNVAIDFDKKEKYFCLIEFPYPSGAGLHVGHVRSWSAMDCFSRKKRMEGKNVLYPIGWDAFGLPAENYAIKNKIHPSVAVEKNIATFKRQVKSLGLSFDWSREINTTDPKYYKWTQWIFLKLYEKGLAYQADVLVNWCPFCKTNLADEEVLPDGKHERCGNITEKRMQKQWLFRITKYAQRLLDDLRTVDYPNEIKTQQVNWIGRKEGIEIKYEIVLDSAKASLEQYSSSEVEKSIKVFTTRPDTNFGATFIAIAPEHELVNEILKQVQDDKEGKEIKDYVEKTNRKTQIEREAEGREKTGVFTGLYAINPLTNYKMPIYISDFVIKGFGTGAVVGVPGHDIRDFEFAKKFNLEIKRVVVGKDNDQSPIIDAKQVQEEEGVMINSGFLDGLDIHEATGKIMNYMEEKGYGKRKTTYKMRDWVFSRQHYWGEPIPVIYCEKDGIVPVLEKDLPVELPYLEKYEPSGTGESPLAKVESWVNTICPKCKSKAKRETDTMPNWAGSNWYFLRYLDPQNDLELAGKEKMKYWMPVDMYQGGFEHTTLHLLYSRFIYKFLYDIGVVPTLEPYKKRRAHGIVLGPDGRKMSKSFGNVINPDDIVKEFGADTLRIYEMFMGPFDQTIAWNEEGVAGCFRFLKRVWQLSQEKITTDITPQKLLSSLYKTIAKVTEDLENFKFNTAVAAMMEFINNWSADEKGLSIEDLKKFLLILAPFAPHMTEELWQGMGEGSIHQQSWPLFDKSLIEDEEFIIAVQINGKTREMIKIKKQELGIKDDVEKIAKESQKIQGYLEGKEIKKVIYVTGKIINFVTASSN